MRNVALAAALAALATNASGAGFTLETSCLLGTQTSGFQGENVGKKVDCSAPGATYTISPSDPGNVFPGFSMQGSVGTAILGPNEFTVTASGNVETSYVGTFDPSYAGVAVLTAPWPVSAYTLKVRADPYREYVVKMSARVSVAGGGNWAATAGVEGNCPGASALAAAGQNLTASGSGQCVFSSDATGLLAFQMNANLTAQAYLGPGPARNDASYTMNVDVTVHPHGNVLQSVGGPTAGVETAPFPAPFVVKVIDNATGAGVAGQGITFQIKDAAGNAVGAAPTATAVTQPDGTASANFPAPGAGTYTVEAACAGCVEGSPAVFSVTVAGIQTYVELVPGAESGTGQREKVGTQLPIPLRVRVRDTTGAVRPGFTIQFTATDPNGAAMTGAFTNPTAVTGSDGVATTTMTLGGVVGTYNVLATCPDCTGITSGGGATPAGLASAGGTAVTGKTQQLSEAGSGDNPQFRDAPNTGGETDTCTARIVAAGFSPSGLPLSKGLLTCSALPIQLQCESDQHNPGDSESCSVWNDQLLPGSASNPLALDLADLTPVPPLGAKFNPLKSGQFGQDTWQVSAIYKTGRRQCMGQTTVTVGMPAGVSYSAPYVDPRESIANGFAPGQTVIYKVDFSLPSGTNLGNQAELKNWIRLLFFLVEIQATGEYENGRVSPQTPLVHVVPGSRELVRKGNGLTLSFQVSLSPGPNIQLPDNVVVSVSACSGARSFSVVVRDRNQLLVPGFAQ